MTKLFGTTGVRKVYGTEFDLDMALKLGKSLGTYLEKGSVLIARDARITGRMVEDALCAGILSTGVDVVKAGIIPTPTLAYNTMKGGYTAGLMITASHNPPEYTGVKFWAHTSMGYTSEEERKIEEIYFSENYRQASWDSLGSERVLETAVDEHIESIMKHCDSKKIASRSFNVIVDPGNGAACVLTPYLMRKVGCRVITLNGQLDGTFPGRRSEPDEESLTDFAEMMKESGANLGIAHDGDSDRVVFVTETGEVVRGDRVIALLAREILSISKGGTIVTTVDSSRILDETVNKAGGEAVRTPVGDIQVAMKVKELGALLGGEACGVFIYPEFHLAPEPFLTACKILELMAETERDFGDLVSEIPIYPLLKTKIHCPNEKKNEVMGTLAELLPNGMADVKEVIKVDGIGLSLQDGWILVRPSGTEPVIRITCESSSEEHVKEILRIATATVEEAISSE
jgi:phosphomannomutase/phosphoglucomutase